MKRSMFVIALALVFSTVTGADVYKWVDEEGNVHFEDAPPEQVNSEFDRMRVSGQPALSDEPSQLLRVSPGVDKTAQDDQAYEEPPVMTPTERRAREQRCVFVRQQLISLRHQLPVYQDEEGRYRTRSVYDEYKGRRQYLDDATRATEIARLDRELNKFCDRPTDPLAEKHAALTRAMSRRCEAAQAELEMVMRPSARSGRDTVERAQRAVELYCGSTLIYEPQGRQ